MTELAWTWLVVYLSGAAVGASLGYSLAQRATKRALDGWRESNKGWAEANEEWRKAAVIYADLAARFKRVVAACKCGAVMAAMDEAPAETPDTTERVQ